MPLTITNASSQSVVFADPSTGFHATAGQYFISYGLDEERYALELNSAPATDGQTVKRHGFRDRAVGPILVAYVGADPDSVEALYTADHNKLRNNALSVVMPNSETFPACNMQQFKKPRPPKDTGHGTYMLRCLLAFEQVRLS